MKKTVREKKTTYAKYIFQGIEKFEGNVFNLPGEKII
jgi:hypothetical protein